MKTKIILIILAAITQLIYGQNLQKPGKILIQSGTKDSTVVIKTIKSRILKSTSAINYCDYVNCKIYAQDSKMQYLGITSQNQYDTESIINPYGEYGRIYSQTSIRNTISQYGNAFSNYSAYSSFATKPPILYKFNSITQSWEIDAYLTKNTYLYTGNYPKLDPDVLISTLESGNCLPAPIIGYPDIMVTDMYIEESSYNINDSVTLHFTILNNSAYSVNSTFFIDVWQDTT